MPDSPETGTWTGSDYLCFLRTINNYCSGKVGKASLQSQWRSGFNARSCAFYRMPFEEKGSDGSSLKKRYPVQVAVSKFSSGKLLDVRKATYWLA